MIGERMADFLKAEREWSVTYGVLPQTSVAMCRKHARGARHRCGGQLRETGEAIMEPVIRNYRSLYQPGGRRHG